MMRRAVARLARLGAGSLSALPGAAAAAAELESACAPHAARRLRELCAAGSVVPWSAAPRAVPWGAHQPAIIARNATLHPLTSWRAPLAGGVLSMHSFGTQADDGGTYTVRRLFPLHVVAPSLRLRDSRRPPPAVQHDDGGKLASLRMDTPFKRAFSKPETLLHFLNAVLNDDAAHRVVAINNVKVKSAITGAIIFDVRCTLANGSNVKVQLQKVNTPSQLMDRLVSDVSNAYAQQWQPGKKVVGAGYALIPVRMVAVIDHLLADSPEASGSLVANVSSCLRAGELPASAAAVLRELLDITFVQLPLAPASAECGAPAAAMWAHLLRHSEEYTVSTLPEALRAEPFVSAAVSARVDAMSSAERGALEVEENHVRDTARAAAELEAAKQRAEQEKERGDKLAQQVAELTKKLRDSEGAGVPGGGKRA